MKLRKLLLVFVNFALFYTILRLMIAISERSGNFLPYYIVTTVYAVGGSAAFIAFYVLNGFSFEVRERTMDELPDKWSSERKMDFLAKQSENKAKARKLIYIILPIILTIAVSYIELMVLK